MSYSINQLAKLAGISVRTLHHYDQIGLLRPERNNWNKYRKYKEEELLKLQQIMFFIELDFPLKEIKTILANPSFKMEQALKEQKEMIKLKKKRLESLIATIDKTIKKIKRENNMTDKELYDKFDMSEVNEYADEAKKRWGHTDAWKQSQERTRDWTKADYAKLKADADKWMKNFAAQMGHGPKSEAAQKLIDEHYNALRTFYEPNLEMYRGLADMYVADERFKAYYEKYAAGLAEFMRTAMHEYCDTH